MKYNKFLTLFFIFILFLVGVFYYFYAVSLQPTTPLVNSPTSQFQVEQKINYGPEKSEEINTLSVTVGQSALDVLSASKKIELQEYSFGKLVISISEVKNGQDDKYWLYYVNDQESKMGAADYKVQPNDRIEWKFKQYEQ